MINEFDNNMNNSEELESKAGSGNSTPETNNQETYRNTYTPSQGGGNSYNSSYSTYSIPNSGYGNGYNMTTGAPAKQK